VYATPGPSTLRHAMAKVTTCRKTIYDRRQKGADEELYDVNNVLYVVLTTGAGWITLAGAAPKTGTVLPPTVITYTGGDNHYSEYLFAFSPRTKYKLDIVEGELPKMVQRGFLPATTHGDERGDAFVYTDTAHRESFLANILVSRYSKKLDKIWDLTPFLFKNFSFVPVLAFEVLAQKRFYVGCVASETLLLFLANTLDTALQLNVPQYWANPAYAEHEEKKAEFAGAAVWSEEHWSTHPTWSPYWTCRALVMAHTAACATLVDDENTKRYDMQEWMAFQVPPDQQTDYDGLEVKQSSITDAGDGLYTTTARKKDDLLCAFYGHWVDKHAWEAMEPPGKEAGYAFTLSDVHTHTRTRAHTHTQTHTQTHAYTHVQGHAYTLAHKHRLGQLPRDVACCSPPCPSRPTSSTLLTFWRVRCTNRWLRRTRRSSWPHHRRICSRKVLPLRSSPLCRSTLSKT